MKLSWKNFKKRKFMINCKTQEEANELCQMMHDRGMRWWNGDSYIEGNNWYCGVTTCYSGAGEYSPRMYYESEGYKVVTFQDFKAYYDQKKLKPLWHSSDEHPTSSQEVMVITKHGECYLLLYSKKHNKFNVSDQDTVYLAEQLAIEIDKWCYIDDAINITGYTSTNVQRG